MELIQLKLAEIITKANSSGFQTSLSSLSVEQESRNYYTVLLLYADHVWWRPPKASR